MSGSAEVCDGSKLVSYSRAGDEFHYRWAARRCLHLLKLKTDLTHITIEGSSEKKMGGEYVIDTAEYRESEGNKQVEYFQLKHTTTQLNKEFKLSGLKGTIEGFAKRFKDVKKSELNFCSVQFTVITNRPICKKFKKSIKGIVNSQTVDKRFLKTIKKYTGLSDSKLIEFCSKLKLLDGEGDYDAQKHQLFKELTHLTFDSSDTQPLLSLVDLVRSRIAPKSKTNAIKKEDVLEQFGKQSSDDLFPAPPLFEDVGNYIWRLQNSELLELICNSNNSFNIFTAEGGVGKSVICCQLMDAITQNGSIAVAYDCFGNGGYRKQTGHRHRASEAYTQIVNQLAQLGLCDVMIDTKITDGQITKGFLSRLEDAAAKAKKLNENAEIVILFDAVDNSMIAAEEIGDSSFVPFLLREDLPKNCKVVYFSRPERVHFFDPPTTIPITTINLFSLSESLSFLQSKYPNATEKEAKEFARLTGSNPRVQANALSLGKKTVNVLLTYLSGSPLNVDDLIKEQLNQTITKIRNLYPKIHRDSIDNICTGLATLPPFVPIEVLAKASGVLVSEVKSFIADLERPFWLTDNYVQFRDEPTESWFRNNYSADEAQIKRYADLLAPLSNQYSYVAEVLPSLLLRSGQYEQLIDLALSDQMLPSDNPVDVRNIQVFRLQYAFKAAIKKNQFDDACKLAMRAGEEVAGSERHMSLLEKNFDLAAKFLPEQRLMEFAYSKKIHGRWSGSENIYSALLLSFISECEGDSRNFLRVGKHWLRRYFEKREANRDNDGFDEKLSDHDVLAMFYCHFNLDGEARAVSFISSLRPVVTYKIAREFASRLIDLGRFRTLERISVLGMDLPGFVIGVNHELLKVGVLLPKKVITRVLNKIIGPGKWLDKPSEYHSAQNQIHRSAFLSLLEASIIRGLPITNVRRAANYYISDPSPFEISKSHYPESRAALVKILAIRACIKSDFCTDTQSFIPKSWKKESEDEPSELKDAKKILGALLPWALIRAELLVGNSLDLNDRHLRAADESTKHLNSFYSLNDPIRSNITNIRFQNIVLSEGQEDEQNSFIDDFKKKKHHFSFTDKFNALRVANRDSRFTDLIEPLEESCSHNTRHNEDETSEDLGENNILISRALYASSQADSEVYFDQAIEAVSRFGDEVVERWEALRSLAEKSSDVKPSSPEMAYRFMRCAELVGNTVNREKHWSRSSAIKTAFKLCPNSVLTILCRWKDRKVGWVDRNHFALLDACIDSNLITSSKVWCLAAFPVESDLFSLAFKCIDKAEEIKDKQIILNNLVENFRIDGVTGNIWNEVSEKVLSHNLEHPVLDDLNFLINAEEIEHISSNDNSARQIDDRVFDGALKNIDFGTLDGIKKVYEYCKNEERTPDFSSVLKIAITKINSSNAAGFLLTVAKFEKVGFFTLVDIFENLPYGLKRKVSVKKRWPEIISCIAERFPDYFLHYYRRKSAVDAFGKDEISIKAMNEGLLKVLSSANRINSAGTFFGFVNCFASQLCGEKANTVLDFAIERFELHIDDDFADGCWHQSLRPSSEIDMAITGYIWSNLASPKAQDRWYAVHAVKRIFSFENHELIKCLFDWFDSNHNLSLVSKKHPFYELHAKQFLLLALNRCVNENPSLLTNHIEKITEIALNEEHLLIQKYTAEVALKIYSACDLEISDNSKDILENVGVSQFPLEKESGNIQRKNTPWHEEGLVSGEKKLHLAHDFKEYWFRPLGNLFRVSAEQVKELAAEIVLNEFLFNPKETYIEDPRAELRFGTEEREAWNDHSSYPKIDSYAFYLSYHAMMVVASRLIKTMPIVQPSYSDEDVWDDWISRHKTTNDDFWLSDRRDFFPLKRRLQQVKNVGENWKWEIGLDDFFDCLFDSKDGSVWLNVAGDWNEAVGSSNEEIKITSRFVKEAFSKSLLRALISHESHVKGVSSIEFFDGHQHKPRSKNEIFHVKKWYFIGDKYNKVDELDPYSGGIQYPLLEVERDISELLGISCDSYNRDYIDNNNGNKVISNQVWGRKGEDSRFDRSVHGNRLQINLAYLKELCSKLKSDLVIQIDINREKNGHGYNQDSELRYTPPYRKVYYFSSDGKLRDRRTTIQVREKIKSESE